MQCAARKLAAALADGSLQAHGERLIGGPAGGAAWEPIDCDTEDSIVAKHRPCEIPCEWLHNRGGWLVIRAATEAAREGDRYYCQVWIEAEAVQRKWPTPSPDHAGCVEWMNKRGAAYFGEFKQKQRAAELQEEFHDAMGAPIRLVKAAYKDVDLRYRNPRGAPRKAPKGP